MASLPPFPGPHPDPFSDRGDWASAIRQGVRYAAALAVSVFATYLGGCVAALLLYTTVFPPLTGVQLQRKGEAIVAGDAYERSYRPLPLSEIDSELPWAVVAGEDSRFFQHHGFDWEEVREAIADYRRGDDLRGASSITQQLVKNLFMSTHSTYLRKILEVPLTYVAEAILSKRRILSLYLNVIEWGPGVYGAEAAAQYHFDHSARRLTRAQAAGLAACIPNPLVRHPWSVGWYQRIILRRMDRLGPLPLSKRSRQEPASTLSHTTSFPRD